MQVCRIRDLAVIANMQDVCFPRSLTSSRDHMSSDLNGKPSNRPLTYDFSCGAHTSSRRMTLCPKDGPRTPFRSRALVTAGGRMKSLALSAHQTAARPVMERVLRLVQASAGRKPDPSIPWVTWQPDPGAASRRVGPSGSPAARDATAPRACVARAHVPEGLAVRSPAPSMLTSFRRLLERFMRHDSPLPSRHGSD